MGQHGCDGTRTTTLLARGASALRRDLIQSDDAIADLRPTRGRARGGGVGEERGRGVSHRAPPTQQAAWRVPTHAHATARGGGRHSDPARPMSSPRGLPRPRGSRSPARTPSSPGPERGAVTRGPQAHAPLGVRSGASAAHRFRPWARLTTPPHLRPCDSTGVLTW